MTCEECTDLIDLYALEALDPAAEEKVRVHIEGCADCRARLEHVRQTLDLIPLSLSPVAPSAGARQQLMSRVASSRPQLAAQPPRRGARRFFEPLLAGAIAAGITAFAFYMMLDRQRQAIASLQTQLDATKDELGRVQSSVQQTSALIRAVQSPAVQVVSVQGTDQQPQAKAKVLWDQTKNQWQFTASGLKSPGVGKMYELWLIDADQKKFPGGTFVVDENGEGSIETKSPASAAKIVALAVTVEPAGGSPQPTSAIQLLGKT